MDNINIYYFNFILISIAISIYAKQFGKQILYYFAKPLTTLFIIAVPLLEMRVEYSPYAYLIVTGLLFSLLGDLFLLFPDKYFNNGLYSFLVTHIFYTLAFNQDVNGYCFGIAFAVIIFLIVVIKYLVPKLGAMKYPVILYILVISAMLYSGLNMDRQLGEITFVSIGAILFTISDTVLAFNKFYKKFRFAEPIILSTYFVAQLFFAISI
jgi:uncharacterized membrane protein YhhN